MFQIQPTKGALEMRKSSAWENHGLKFDYHPFYAFKSKLRYILLINEDISWIQVEMKRQIQVTMLY